TCGMAEFVNVHVGSFVSRHRTMRRHRRRIHPVTPQSMTDFHVQLTGDYAHLSMIHNESIYCGIVGTTHEEGTTLLFILPGIKKTGSTFLLDGTFSSSPSFGNECHQLYVIMGIAFNTGFPIGFALMSRKTERAYTALFNKILSIVPEWQPQIIIVDFERAAIAAIRTIFPYTTIRGCWFHSSQAVWRKVANIGLVEICSNHRGAYDTVHMLMALPLLPQNCIAEGFETVREYYIENVQSLISNNNDYKFSLLFEYYRSTWLA
ncbi:MULE domain-containing protein, partial [Aphis craccivora]